MGHGRGKSKTDAQGIGPRFDAARRRTRKTGPTQTLKSSDRRARTLQRQAGPKKSERIQGEILLLGPAPQERRRAQEAFERKLQASLQGAG